MTPKCMKCGKQATHKFVKIDKNYQTYDLFFCADHAAEHSPLHKPKPLGDILAKLLASETEPKGEGKGASASVRCSHCGLSFDAYKRSLLLGCSNCYESFYDLLMPELRKFHGSTKHVGRKPGGGLETSPSVEKTAAPALPPPEKKKRAPAAAKDPATQGGATLIKDAKSAIAELTKAMNQAIAAEDFEKAALCRDQINEIRRMSANK